MTQDYYGTKRITASPEQKDGVDGYAVKYNDGYTSWSPKDVFEEAYQPITGMNFGHALKAINEGKILSRKGWNGPDQFVRKQSPDANSKMTLPYLYMKNTDGELVPWLASQRDLLANDWFIVKE